ncbi:hypothetical protein DF152_17255 [Burkholderia cenocepacia]|nr:hypothetical protein DF152_17255 [Burkholderia cenocepacia]
MSKEMREYLAAYLAWVEAGAPDGSPFRRAWGLCSNVDLFGFADSEAYARVAVELSESFVSSGVDPDYPFGGFSVYWDDSERGRHHENEQRLAWIREQLNKPE